MARVERKKRNLLKGLSILDALENVDNQEGGESNSHNDVDNSFEEIDNSPSRPYAESFKETAFGKNLTDGVYTIEAGSLCPHCKYALLDEDISFSGKVCEFFVYCPNCNAHICTYKPMDHQKAFHEDEHMKKLYAGGFGSAKTYTCGMEFIAHALQVEGGAGLIGAATWGQASDTCLKFVTDNIPAALVAKSNQDKVNWYIDLINGFRISAKALDKEGKIRSANLTIIWVEEASEVPYNVITYIMARLRNKKAFVKGKSRLSMLLSSNPDVGWLKTDWLEVSGEIYYHGDVKVRYKLDPARQDPVVSTHISATSANIYLPPNYERDLAKNRPAWWVNRYLKGSFEYAEGLVYPNFSEWFVDPFVIPKHWKRITGTDFGRRDPTAHVVGALDPVRKIIYVYVDIEQTLDDITLDQLIDKIKKSHDFPDTMLAYPQQCDPRGRNKDQVSGQSWIDAYRQRGIIFQTAQDCEQNSLAPTIEKLNAYAMAGRLKFFKTCKNVWNAFSKYKYQPRDLGDDDNQGEIPMDKFNHIPDALRYMLSPFPPFPTDGVEFDTIWQETMNKFTMLYDPFAGFDPVESDYVTDFSDNFG